MDIKEILRDAKSHLSESGISQVDAEYLLAHVLGISRMDLHNSVLVERVLSEVSESEVFQEQFLNLMERRINHEPLQYLTGVAPFRYLEVAVGPGVLVPRPESELLVDAVLTHIKNLPSPVRCRLRRIGTSNCHRGTREPCYRRRKIPRGYLLAQEKRLSNR